MDFGPDYFREVRRFGVGVGINPSDFHPSYLADGVDFFEVTAPSVRHRGTAPYSLGAASGSGGGFERRGIPDLAATATVLVHSTNINPVYAEAPAEADLVRLGELLRLTGAPWVTEDLGVWLMSERHVYPHFMPLPLTADTLAVATENIRFVQDVLGLPFNAEFPPMTYVVGDMNAFEFFARLCDATGCGMCLDVGHVLSYQLARGASASAGFHRIPWDSVTEIHFAGGSIDLVREGFQYHDVHGDLEVVSICLDLIDEIVETAPHLRAIALELFGARSPGRALDRLRTARARPTVNAWLAGVPAQSGTPDPEAARERVRTLSVAMYDLLHTDQPISGARLGGVAGVFAADEQRRWDRDRQARLKALGKSLVAYYPVTAGWLRRTRDWTSEHLYARLIAAVDGTAPPGAEAVAGGLHTLLQEGESGLLHDLLDCETWMNQCVNGLAVPHKRRFGIDADAASAALTEPAARLDSFAGPVELIYLGDNGFVRRGAAAVPAVRDAVEPAACGTARCCTGD
ncbi:DUF692 family multinuclear iron-containing protein [Pseudosporangium ferrugineum]|uniref:Uncharacterized protein (UPF0276 family) n=1 Tax=Pseudosporangium ferrugineum TaxID=439699 RepID=A0A2T0RIJ2_9ACTN|nr:DUF692 family multinuclear iron-containing protein [Pseudosporangium ferrugineum]PRY21024.1 uncharacterized protein (UPF0276 family) [Pseudosporangium ferrugineum]